MPLPNPVLNLTAAWYVAKINREAKRFQDTHISRNLYARMRKALDVNDQHQAAIYAGQLSAAHYTYMYLRCVPALVRLALETYPDIPAAKKFLRAFHKVIRQTLQHQD